jgi:hypothetical protein
MTETKWLDFAGFLNKCTYGLEYQACPFQKIRQLDQYQKLEHLFRISEKEAFEMMDYCENHRKNCQKPNRELSLKLLELELAP